MLTLTSSRVLQLNKYFFKCAYIHSCVWVCMSVFQFSSVTQLCLTLGNSMNHSTPGLPVHHQLPEFIQTHVHWVSDAIQSSHPLLSPDLLTFNVSQDQGLFQWVSSLHQVVKLLDFQLQHQSFQWTLRTNLFRLDWSDLFAVQGTLKSSLTTQLKSTNYLVLSFPYGPTITSHMTTGKTIALTRRTFLVKVMFLFFNMLSRLVIIFFQGVSVF